MNRYLAKTKVFESLVFELIDGRSEERRSGGTSRPKIVPDESISALSERHNSKLSVGSKGRARLLERVDSAGLGGHVPRLLYFF